MFDQNPGGQGPVLVTCVHEAAHIRVSECGAWPTVNRKMLAMLGGILLDFEQHNLLRTIRRVFVGCQSWLS